MESNPFSDPHASNPFSDPSVQQATGAGNAGQRQGMLDDYNPFAEGGNQTRGGAETGGGAVPPPRGAGTTQPAIMTPSEEPPPYSSTGAQKVDTGELQRRQEELEQKAAELQRKENALKNAQGGTRQNNWPPLPKFVPIGPCFYQDFSVDIPLEFQRIVKFVYYLWGFHVLVLFLNVLASLAWFIVDSDGGTTFGLSILWFILFTPCSFICWYRPLYKAFRSDSSFNFFVFFFVFFFQFCVYIIQCIGITDFTVGIIAGLGMVGRNLAAGLIMIFVGIFFALQAIMSFAALVKLDSRRFLAACSDRCALLFAVPSGWINGIRVASKTNVGAGSVMLFVAFFFSIEAVMTILFLIKVHRIYRSTGASFQKAQAEFATGVMRNETVQNAAADAASGAARGAVTGQYGSNNRY
ncbi:hypothetical protein ACOMHN_012185 [Nucella lapillus]